MPSKPCQRHIQSPFAAIAHLFICLLVPASYIPQLTRIATSNQNGNSAISGWYIILLTTSSTAHLATRLNCISSSEAWKCVRHGELDGLDAFSALVVYIQPFLHWLSAILLLCLYVAFRSKPPTRHEGDIGATTPSNSAILAIVITHAAITLLLAFCLLHFMTGKDGPFNNPFVFVVHTYYELFLQTTGLLTSLTAFIPQLHLILTRARDSHHHFDQGTLSTLSIALQVLAFTLLAASQGWRMRQRPWTPSENGATWIVPTQTWSLKWWVKVLFGGGRAAGWLGLAVSQLIVLCVALAVGGDAGYIAL
ncbi:hypothetical protein BJX68DRAFT_237294 [Aspergillus pseudodeflectus]|uniref:Uncharacterized protein n=1 Tax=Aspergillus pseudodeflectus TaxID=176178 RepID=A0ABR4KCQ2_9EURO